MTFDAGRLIDLWNVPPPADDAAAEVTVVSGDVGALRGLGWPVTGGR